MTSEQPTPSDQGPATAYPVDHLPARPAPAALPPVGARLVAFAAICVAGFCGGLIGYAVVDIQCTGDCSTPSAIGALIGAVLSAAGVAVVSVLALRAMSEWKSRQTDPRPMRLRTPGQSWRR